MPIKTVRGKVVVPKVGPSVVPAVQPNWANPPANPRAPVVSSDPSWYSLLKPPTLLQSVNAATTTLAWNQINSPWGLGRAILGRLQRMPAPAGDVASAELSRRAGALGQTLGRWVGPVGALLSLGAMQSSDPLVRNMPRPPEVPPNPWGPSAPMGSLSGRTWNAYQEARRIFPSATEAQDAYRRRNIWQLYQGGQ